MFCTEFSTGVLKIVFWLRHMDCETEDRRKKLLTRKERKGCQEKLLTTEDAEVAKKKALTVEGTELAEDGKEKL